MNTHKIIKLFQTAVIAASVGSLGATDAMAWSFGSWGSFGNWGSFRSCGSYGSYGGHHRRVHYRSYGSYGSYGWQASSPRRTTYSAYASASNYAPPAPLASAPETERQSEATIHVRVPADAEVFVDNQRTSSTGPARDFVSRGLLSGETYAYKLRVEFEQGGERVVENKLVQLQAGDTIDLEFGKGEQLAEARASQTGLTLHVPENAEVTLNGTSTSQLGPKRTFITTMLPEGQKQQNYTVRVQDTQNGQPIAEERIVTLIGGERHELTFDFSDDASTKLAGLD